MQSVTSLRVTLCAIRGAAIRGYRIAFLSFSAKQIAYV